MRVSLRQENAKNQLSNQLGKEKELRPELTCQLYSFEPFFVLYSEPSLTHTHIRLTTGRIERQGSPWGLDYNSVSIIAMRQVSVTLKLVAFYRSKAVF